MACAPSQRYKNTDNDEINDPILQFIEKIRSEYCNYKKEKDEIITALQKTNLNLTKTINDLSDKLNSTFGSPINVDRKRRKTNSCDDSSDVDSAKLFGRINILDSASDKSTDSVFNKAAGSPINIDNRRIKIHSSDDSDADNAKLISNINIVDSPSNKSIDSALNEAINNENITLNDSEILFPQTQTTNYKTPTKKPTSSNNKNILSPVNNNIIMKKNTTPVQDITTPPLFKKEKGQLQKRLKSILVNPLESSNNENENPIKKNDGWKSKNQINQKPKNLWNMSFVQPVQVDENNLNISGDVIACSQNVKINSKDRNKPSSKHSHKLRQSKLEFDLKIEKKPSSSLKNEDNETFCEESVGASPTCTNSINSKDSKITRTLRKIPRKKNDGDLFIFPIKKSLSNESITTVPKENRSKTSSIPTITPTKQNQIKIEPKTAKKDDDVLLKSKFFEHMLTEDSIEGLEPINTDSINKENKDNTVKKMLDDDSSLFILPSQPDDVIIVDDTDRDEHYYNLSSMDLLAEMLRDEKDTQPLLKRFEAEQIKSLQSTDNDKKKSISPPSTSRLQLPQNKYKPVENYEAELAEIFDDKNDFTTTTTIKSPEKKGFHHDCDECQKFKKYLISQNVPLDEIERRLRTCKIPPKLHHTPDGFWNPRFREWSQDDPRNEVLIDYRFVNKKKSEK